MANTRHDSQPVTIECEVTEIDGVQVDQADPAPSPDTSARKKIRVRWHERVRTLDSRWWPLWLLLGIIAVILALTLGLAIAAIFLIIRMIITIFGKAIAWFTGFSQTHVLSRR